MEAIIHWSLFIRAFLKGANIWEPLNSGAKIEGAFKQYMPRSLIINLLDHLQFWCRLSRTRPLAELEVVLQVHMKT